MNKEGKLIQLLSSWLDHVTRALWLVSGSLVVLMAIVVGYQVVMRYIFRNASAPAYELILILMLACAVFSLAHTQRLGKHLRIDILDRFFPKLMQDIIVNIVGPVLGLVFCVPLVWKTWERAWFALQTGQSTNTTGIPTAPMMIAIPVGIGLLGLVLLFQILRYLVSLKTKDTTIMDPPVEN
ncbi:MAG: TRAP transporter small permease [Dehalococcoidia bacterium]